MTISIKKKKPVITDLKPTDEWHGWLNAFGICEEFRERVEMLEEAERLMKIKHSPRISRHIRMHHKTAKAWMIDFLNELIENIEPNDND